MPFRLQAKNVFLTYPQIKDDLTAEQFLEFYTSKFKDQLKGASVATETHADGGKHIHALLTFNEKIRTRENRLFDFQSEHPNIQSARRPRDVLRYIGKDNAPITFGTHNTGRTYDELINESKSSSEFITGVIREHPRDAALNLRNLLQFAEYRWKPEPEPYQPSFSCWTLTDEMNEYKNQMNNQGVQ